MNTKKKILIVVDYQNDFVKPDGALSIKNADKIADKIQERINSDYDDIIYTFDTHTKKQYENSEEAKLFPQIHCEFGTDGWELYDGIQPKFLEYNALNKLSKTPFNYLQVGNEHFFTKDVFDIWEGNNMYPYWFVDRYEENTIIDVVGVAYEFCVRMHVKGLVERGYKVNLIEECTESITEEGYQEARDEFEKLGVNLV